MSVVIKTMLSILPAVSSSSAFLKIFFCSWDHFFKSEEFRGPPFLVPFESKFINFVAYFNANILTVYALWHFLLLVYDVQYVTISMCRLGVNRTIKNVINTWKVSVLRSSVMNSSRPWQGYKQSSFSNPSVGLPTSQLILEPFRYFTYVTAHCPTLLSFLLRHKLFTYVTWRAANATRSSRGP